MEKGKLIIISLLFWVVFYSLNVYGTEDVDIECITEHLHLKIDGVYGHGAWMCYHRQLMETEYLRHFAKIFELYIQDILKAVETELEEKIEIQLVALPDAPQPPNSIGYKQMSGKIDGNKILDKLFLFLDKRDKKIAEYIRSVPPQYKTLKYISSKYKDEYNYIISPKGSSILFKSWRNGNPDLYLMKLDGSEIKQLTDDDVIEDLIQWSPNGEKIAYTADEVLYLIDIKTYTPKQITIPEMQVINYTFSDTGEEILILSDLLRQEGNLEPRSFFIYHLNNTSTIQPLKLFDGLIPKKGYETLYKQNLFYRKKQLYFTHS